MLFYCWFYSFSISGDRNAEKISSAAFGAMRDMISARLGHKSGGGGAGGGDEKDVIVLTDSNFEKTVINSDDMWLVEFYAPWCGHCKSLAPHWASAATELKGKVKVAKLDATEEKSMANKYGIRGFPTIKYFPAGKKDWDSAQEYTGMPRPHGGVVNIHVQRRKKYMYL